MADNKVLFGLSNVHYAVYDEGAGTYQTPVKVPGAVNLSADPEGEKNEMYADNIPYFVLTANAGYSGDLEMAKFPDAMRVALLGDQIDVNGMVVETTDALPVPFALLFEVEGDEKKRRFVYYNAKMERPKAEHSTSEKSVQPKTESAGITFLPTVLDGRTVVRGAIELSDTNETAYNGFFTSVLTPTWVAG